jgi:hypothetical protein
MNPDGRSQRRRRRGAYAAVLSAAAGAALAAAMIPAAPAFADALGAATICSGECQTDAAYQTYFAPDYVKPGDVMSAGGVMPPSYESVVETHTNGFLGLIGSVNASWETEMESDLSTMFTTFSPTPGGGGSVLDVDPQFTTFLTEADLSNHDVSAVQALNALIDNDIVGGASGPAGTALESDLAAIFTNFDFAIGTS